MLNTLKLPAAHEITGNTAAIASIMPLILFCNLLNVGIVAFALSETPKWVSVWIWAALSTTFFIGLLSSALSKKKHEDGKRKKGIQDKVTMRKRMERKAIVLSFLAALPWVSITFMTLTAQPGPFHILASNISIGMATAGSVVLASIPRAAIVYMASILLPLTIISFFLIHDPVAPYIALLGVSLMFFLYIVIGMTARVFKDRTAMFDELKFSKYQIEETNHELEKLTNLDALSGLKNRQAFTSSVERVLGALSGVSENGCGIFYLDIDDFAGVNQRFGHEAGDKLIRQIADNLKDLWHEEDVIARISGDEFAIIAAGVRSASEVDGLAQGLLAEIKGSYLVGQAEIDVRASVGAVFLAKNLVSATSLLRLADNAKDIAKNAGGNRYWVHDLDNLWSAVVPENDKAKHALEKIHKIY